MGMVAGSHNRNEFVMIRHDGDAPGPAKPTKSANGQQLTNSSYFLCTYNYDGDYKDKDGVKGLCVVGAINNCTSQLPTYGRSSPP
ncbi:CESA4 (CELLULOSE SYNTHASE A4) [Zea mays]|uniref:CESA4 (CELLULOSE SYNTHASE A4) n=1 Tax=Zea mays TaxID=4577 RepID=A0A1D6KUP1_MAIZE|nr:CESA4 (CELLULOSE SYNTHASE A4) [Zea mays]